MIISKKSEDSQLYLYMNGKLIYKRWLDTGVSKVFDVMAYDKYTLASYRDLDYEKSNGLISVKAKLKIRTPEEGGRKTGFISGYRPNHVFEYHNDEIIRSYMGDIVFDDQQTIEPGEEKIVTVRFLLNQRVDPFLNVGRKWWIHEGGRVIGEAEIIEI
jgi:hypothetical protein